MPIIPLVVSFNQQKLGSDQYTDKMAASTNQTCNLVLRRQRILNSVLKVPHVARTTFMSLPSEVRQMIYVEHFLAHPVVIRSRCQRTYSGSVGRRFRFHASVKLLLVSKAICEESQPLLFSYTTFSFEFFDGVAWLETKGSKDPSSFLRLSRDVCNKIQRVKLEDSWSQNGLDYYHQPVLFPLSVLEDVYNIRPKSMVIDISCFNFQGRLDPECKKPFARCIRNATNCV